MKSWWCRKSIDPDYLLLAMFLLSIVLLIVLAVLILSVPTSLAV